MDSNFCPSTVHCLPGTRKVRKSFLDEYKETHFPVEKEVCECLTVRGHPPTILKYHSVDKVDPAGIILELAEKRNLYEYRWNNTRVLDKPPIRDDF